MSGVPFLQIPPRLAHALSHRPGYASGMAIWGTSYEILEELKIDGHRVKRISSGFREDWSCDCKEFMTIKPLSMKAWCEHVEKAAINVRYCEYTHVQ